MTERSIVEAAARLRRHGEPHLVATVMCVNGTAVRRPGARMLLTRFRWVAGTVSGGCLEGDIANQGWCRTRTGEPLLLTYDSRADEADDDDIRSAFGLGCDGIVEVLVERVGVPGRIDALEFAGRCIKQQQRGAVATVFRGTGVRAGARLALAAGGELEQDADPIDPALRALIAADLYRVIESGRSINRTYAGDVEVLIEALLPPVRLFLFGTGHDAMPIAQLARDVGWDVIVCAREPRFSTRERFALADEILIGEPHVAASRIDGADRAVAIVIGHSVERDRAALEMLLATQAAYIGVLGPRSRTQRLVPGALGDPRVRAPIGLAIGAETPQEIALAVIAEIQGVLAQLPARPLRQRPESVTRTTASQPVAVAL